MASVVPAKGLAVARMIGHITYMSDASMAEKFGRRIREDNEPLKFGAEFEVEGYLQYRGDNFVKRFDANSYLYITKAIDYFNILNGNKTLANIFKGLKAKVLVISFKSDWLVPIVSISGYRESLQIGRCRHNILRNKLDIWT